MPQASKGGSGRQSRSARRSATLAAVETVLRKQHHVVTRKQALACGLTQDMLTRRTLHDGPWQRLLPGVFLALTGIPTQDQREIAALPYAGRASTISGQAALRRHGLRVQATDKVDVLIPAGRRRQNAAFVVLHYTRRVPDPVCYQGPIHSFCPPGRWSIRSAGSAIQRRCELSWQRRSRAGCA